METHEWNSTGVSQSVSKYFYFEIPNSFLMPLANTLLFEDFKLKLICLSMIEFCLSWLSRPDYYCCCIWILMLQAVEIMVRGYGDTIFPNDQHELMKKGMMM